MDEELKKRIEKARALGYTDEQINATIQAKQQQDAAKIAPPAPSAGMAVDDATGGTPPPPEKKGGFIRNVVGAIVKPAVDYTKMVGGAGFEGIRAIKSAAGDKNAYVDDQGNAKPNPFLSDKELEEFSPSAQDGVTKPIVEGAKRTAGMMSYFVPGGKTVEGAGALAKIGAAAKQGAVVGGLTGFSQGESEDLEGMAVDTATGAVTGAGTGAALSAGGQVLEKMKGAKDAASKSIVSPQVAATPKAMAKKDQILQGLDDMGINAGNAEERLRQVGQKYDEIQTQVNEIAKNSGAVKDVKRLQYTMKNALAEDSNYFVPDDPTYTKILDREMSLLNKRATNGRLTISDIVAYKNELAGKLGNAFRKINGESSAAMTPIEGVRMDLWDQMDNLITATEPKLKDLTLKQSLLHQASPGLLKSAEKVSELKPFGIPTGFDMNDKSQSIRSGLAGGASAIGDAAAAIPPVVTAQGAKAAEMVAAGGSVASQPVDDTEIMPDPGATVPDVTTPPTNEVQFVSPDGQWQMMSDGKAYSMDNQWVFDQEANDWVENPNASTDNEAIKAQLMETMKTTTEKKVFDFAKAKYDQLVKMEGGDDKGGSLTGGQQTELSDIDSSIKLMGTLPKTIEQYEGKMGPVAGRLNSLNEYDEDAQTFNAKMKAVAQIVGKAMEGGVLRKEDELKYQKMLPTIHDIPEVARNKIKNVNEMLTMKAKIKRDEYGGAIPDYGSGLDISAATAQ